MYARYATRQHIYTHVQKQGLRRCQTLDNSTCIKNYYQRFSPRQADLDHQLAYRQFLMESVLTAKGETELRDYLTKTTNDIWSLSSTGFLQWGSKSKNKTNQPTLNLDNSNREIHQRANTICGFSRSGTKSNSKSNQCIHPVSSSE
jgi:hypothetical protein